MTAPALAAALAGGLIAVAPVVAAVGLRRTSIVRDELVGPAPTWLRRLRVLRDSGRLVATRRRTATWIVAGLGVWLLSGWPVVGVATAAVGACLPWLFGSTQVVKHRIATVEALEAWCRRMADTLSGGGAIGLMQAIVATSAKVDESIASATRVLAHDLQSARSDRARAFREFADAVDDRVGDAVAAALLLALHQQSSGVAEVLRQLADGVARDVRARREIEASRAESRQSIRMLLLIQAGLLGLMATVPTFAAPYGTAVGQIVMALLLSGTVGLLIWMRRLSIGRRPPRFLGASAGPS